MLTLLVLAGPDAFGADFPIALRRADQAAIAKSRPGGQLEASAIAETAATNSITLGLAYEHDEDGSHALTTPFLLDSQSDPWEFTVSGDGYTQAVSSGKSVSGFADVDVAAQYAFAVTSGWSITPGLGFTLPVAGAIGSRHLAEQAQLLVAFSPDAQWTVLAGGTVRRSGDAPPGVSAYSDALLAKALYARDASHAAFVAFKRKDTRGAGGNSTLIGEIDFPWRTSPAAVSLAQGLSRGKRFTAIELDLSF